MQSHLIRVAVSQLNQWALDFKGNLERIKISIRAAKRAGATFRTGPELELCGYGCEDHFLEPDTADHCWQGLTEILDDDELTYGILCDIGMPVQFGAARYNCRVFCLNGRILLIRPKTALANDGNFREGRYFASWDPTDLTLYDFNLKSELRGMETNVGFPPRSNHHSPRLSVSTAGGTAPGAPNSPSSSNEEEATSSKKVHHLHSFVSALNLNAPSALSTAPSGFCPASLVLGTIQQSTCKFGLGVIQCDDVVIGAEICEEAWTPQALHITMGLDGVDIITNSSGSHHELRKLETRLKLITTATLKGGGAYLYSNLMGCDGGRLYFDGASFVVVNGLVANMASCCKIGNDVEVLTTTIDVAAIRAYRSKVPSLQMQAALNKFKYQRVIADIAMTSWSVEPPAAPIENVRLPLPEEEIAGAPACWLWDYLRRSNAGGFFLPLSGGADSAAVATIVGSMCQKVMQAVSRKETDVIHDLERVLRISSTNSQFPQTPEELANLILHTCYMKTENSSKLTRQLAEDLAAEIGAYHITLRIDDIITVFLKLVAGLTGGLMPRFKIFGGTDVEDLALQNLQARVRMVFAYLLASLIPWFRSVKDHQVKSSEGETKTEEPNKNIMRTGGYLLVLSAGNVDECLRGYMTKYDCSSADLNPIGSISKGDLKMFLIWAAVNLNYRTLGPIIQAPPTAELRPLEESGAVIQTDEEEMGITYAELGHFGKLRKMARCGPVTMLRALICDVSYTKTYTLRQIAEKVKHFFRCYCRNRHKLTTLTPALHCQGYSVDDNRFDLRPFLYPDLSAQFEQMDKLTDFVAETRSRASNAAVWTAAAADDSQQQSTGNIFGPRLKRKGSLQMPME